MTVLLLYITAVHKYMKPSVISKLYGYIFLFLKDVVK